MRWLVLAFSLLTAPPLAAQQPALPPGRPEDVASVDALMRAIYDVISGPAGQQRDWDRMRSPEREIGRVQEQYGNIVHLMSAYDSKRTAEDPQPFARGDNSFQLFNDGSRWWVVTIYWEQESSASPIPSRFLNRP